ncbi:uncharacterized [Tachysurus ichikawai]
MVMNGRLQHHQSAATGISGSKTKRKPFPGVFRERASGLHGADTVDVPEWVQKAESDPQLPVRRSDPQQSKQLRGTCFIPRTSIP